MATRGPSPAVLAARALRKAKGKDRDVRIQWFIKEVSDKVALTFQQRVRIATEFVKDQVVRNISIPVVKSSGVVIERSKPGEFPRAETSHLRRTIFAETKKTKRGYDGFVGTPLDYGLILETKLNRSFLKRTLEEEIGKVRRILTGPIK